MPFLGWFLRVVDVEVQVRKGIPEALRESPRVVDVDVQVRKGIPEALRDNDIPVAL